MQVKVLKNEKSQVELEITVTVEEIKPSLEKATKNISKDVKVAGFRQGNVPYDVLKQKVGDTAIWQEAAEIVIPTKIFEAIKQEKLEIAEQPQVEITKLAADNDLVFIAKFATVPKVKIGDYKKLKLKRQEVKIDDKKIDKTIDDIRKMRSKETLVTREAEMSDKVLVDIDMFNNKVAIEGGQSKGAIIILGDSYFIPGLDEKIVGMKAEDTKEFTLPYPDTYYDKKLAGKKIDFKVKVNSVYAMELPELNEEFLTGLGNFKNADDLRKQIVLNLENEEGQKLEHQLENELFTKVVDCCEFDEIPQGLIDAETERMFAEMRQNIEGQGIKFDDYLLQMKKTEEEIKKDFQDKAKKRTQVSLAIRQISLNENIQAEEKDIEDEIDKILKMYPNNEEVKAQVESENYRLRLGDIVVNQKTVQHLKDNIIDDKNKKDDTKSAKPKTDKKPSN